jgi:hypothetical protein
VVDEVDRYAFFEVFARGNCSHISYSPGDDGAFEAFDVSDENFEGDDKLRHVVPRFAAPSLVVRVMIPHPLLSS